MRNWILTALVAAFVAAPMTANAGALSYPSRTFAKLVHGLMDVVYSPAEILISPVTHAIDFDRHDRVGLWGAQLGLFTGLVKANARLGRGVSDVVTFLLPSERHDNWSWDWSYQGVQTPLSEQIAVEDAR